MQQATKQQLISRSGEEGKITPRRKRFYLRDNNWYYLTRSDQEHGPFKTLTDAKRDLSLFLRRSGVVRFTL